jgi:hypothetical protein
MRQIRLVLIAAIVGIVSALSIQVASAASPHFIGDVDFTDQGETLLAQGKIAGLGNEDTVILMTATGVPTVTCTNPSGSNQPPGQNPGEITLAGGEEIPEDDVTNGNIIFSVGTEEPEDPAPKAAGCPGNRWTAAITDVDFSSATIQFFQGTNCALTPQGEPNNNCELVFAETFLGL